MHLNEQEDVCHNLRCGLGASLSTLALLDMQIFDRLAMPSSCSPIFKSELDLKWISHKLVGMIKPKWPLCCHWLSCAGFAPDISLLRMNVCLG